MFLGFRSRKFNTSLFVILRSFGVLISARCCGLFNKFNTYFPAEFGLWPFFRKLIFYNEDIKNCSRGDGSLENTNRVQRGKVLRINDNK